MQNKKREKAEVEYRVKQACASTKSGLQFNLSGFAKLELIDDKIVPL